MLSFPAVSVLHAVASGVPYGFQIIDETGLTSGTVYTSLGRLERDGYVTSRWEDARTAHQEKRPPRRYYTITASGERVLRRVHRGFRGAPARSGGSRRRTGLTWSTDSPPAPGSSLIRLLAAIVPRGTPRRSGWPSGARRFDGTSPTAAPPPVEARLMARCAGALPHAIWTRKEEWTLDMLLHDLRYAVRQLSGRPAFTLLAVLTLALGIGANTAIFSVVHGVLLKPLPYAEPDRLVQLWETNPLRNWTEATIAPANLLDWRERNRVFDDIAWYMGSDTREGGTASYTLNEGDEAEHVEGQLVSANFFHVLGVQPVMGRDFTKDEAVPGQHRVMLLSHGFWQRRFGGRPRSSAPPSGWDPTSTWSPASCPPGSGSAGPRWTSGRRFPSGPNSTATLRRPHFLRAVARLQSGRHRGRPRGRT